MERIRKEIAELEDFERKYAFLSSIGVKILKTYDFSQIEGFIKAPDNSLYRNGIFNFIIKYNLSNYPSQGPELFLKTKIFHTECSLNGNCCISFLKDWKTENNLLGILSVLYEFFVYQTYSGYELPRSLFNKYNISKFNETCQEYLDKYAYKEFNGGYDYLFQNDYTPINLSCDYFTLTFVFIENSSVYQFKIQKNEENMPASTYLNRYTRESNKALISGNKVFHPSVSIKECLNSKIIFIIPLLIEFSYYNDVIKKELNLQ